MNMFNTSYFAQFISIAKCLNIYIYIILGNLSIFCFLFVFFMELS